MNVSRGPLVPDAPRLSVVVMSIHADPKALTALEALEGPGIEKILVNTGAGSFAGRDGLDDVVLVEDARRRLPGGTRNLGLREARAPIVAFLAADCVMPRDALERRIAAHDEGYDLVSSTLRPLGESPSSWAAYIYIHRKRMPEFQNGTGSLFGVSYRRDLFDRVGFFDESMRVSEDAEFNGRCSEFPALIARDIVTYHRYPETLAEACDDVARRAVREMRHRQRSGLRQAASEFVRSCKLTAKILVTPGLPPQARRAAILLPVLGLSAAVRCLRAEGLRRPAAEMSPATTRP